MGKTRILFAGTLVGVTTLVLVGALLTTGVTPSQSVQAAVAMLADEAEPAPPAGQTYTGSKKCASCHFEQFMSWNKDSHSKVFDLLPAEYQTDAKCLACHTTGYGEETGFKDVATSAALKGVTCESCHGPGSEHDKIASKYGSEKLNAEQEKEVRDSIWMMLPENVCVSCHLTKGHKKSETPPELIKKD